VRAKRALGNQVRGVLRPFGIRLPSRQGTKKFSTAAHQAMRHDAMFNASVTALLAGGNRGSDCALGSATQGVGAALASLLAALTAPQRAAVVERASTALPRTELPRRLSRIWEAPSQTRPRGAAAILSLRVQRGGRLHRRDAPSAADSRRSPASCILKRKRLIEARSSFRDVAR